MIVMNWCLLQDTLGWSALSYAARMGHKLVVEKLLEKGSDILMTDKVKYISSK